MKNPTKALNDFSNLFLQKDIEELTVVELRLLFKHEHHIVINYLKEN